MTQINPMIGSAIQATGVQRTLSAEKDRHLQRAADLQKNSALAGDRFEHAVESSEELSAIHEEQKNNPKKKRQQTKRKPQAPLNDSQEPHLDLTA